jgi:hypothetical protein
MALTATIRLEPDMLAAAAWGLRVKWIGWKIPAAIGSARLF